MEQRRWDGEAELTDWAELIRGAQKQDGIMLKKIIEATKNKENKYVALHNPESVVTMKDGTQYKVMPDGSWRKIFSTV